MIKGFKDKLYWRTISGNVYHCYAWMGRDAEFKWDQWGALCGRLIITHKIGGQKIERPRPELRCGMCDVLEAERRGWEQPAP